MVKVALVSSAAELLEPAKKVRRPTLVDIATVVLVCCALASTVLAANRRATSTPKRRSRATIEPRWQEYAAAGHRIGNVRGAVEIVEFGDFECPYCRKFSVYLDSLKRTGREVTLIYRHLPGRSHLQALPAARASECADEQGNFQAMYNALIYNADSLGRVPYTWFARHAGVRDSAAFARCMNSSGSIPNLHEDTLAASRLRISGTPTLLIESQRYDGLPPFDSLRAFIDRAAATRHTSRK